MDHAEARDILETAAVEPAGLERLAAGDIPEAAALAGHLAGCLECTDEMERLRRSSGVIRAAVRTLPPPDLRARTLAFVNAVGRDRSTAGAANALAAGSQTVQAASVETAASGQPRRSRRPGSRLAAWALATAAAVAIAVVGTAAWVGGSRDALIAEQAEDVRTLAKVALWTLRIDGTDDARHVDLISTTDADATGTLVFSPASTELVVLAQGLPAAPAGMEYRCWVELDGRRARVGRMFPGGGVSYWVGEVPELMAVTDGTAFGVTLVSSDGVSLDGEPVLAGEL